MLLVPGLAVIVPPPHAPERLLGVEICNPGGSGSLKPMPVREVAFGFVSVKVSVVEPLSGMAGDPKVSWRVGGAVGCAADAAPTNVKVASSNGQAR